MVQGPSLPAGEVRSFQTALPTRSQTPCPLSGTCLGWRQTLTGTLALPFYTGLASKAGFGLLASRGGDAKAGGARSPRVGREEEVRREERGACGPFPSPPQCVSLCCCLCPFTWQEVLQRRRAGGLFFFWQLHPLAPRHRRMPQVTSVRAHWGTHQGREHGGHPGGGDPVGVSRTSGRPVGAIWLKQKQREWFSSEKAGNLNLKEQ